MISSPMHNVRTEEWIEVPGAVPAPNPISFKEVVDILCDQQSLIRDMTMSLSNKILGLTPVVSSQKDLSTDYASILENMKDRNTDIIRTMEVLMKELV